MGQIGFYVDPKFGLGIDLCIADGMGFVEALRSEGSLPEWNADMPPELQIQRGDRIDAFKVKGAAERKLYTGKEFEPGHHRAIVLKITKPSFYTVMAKVPFGVKMKRSNCHKAFFIVSNILPSGNVQKWNQQCPNRLVSIGDIILGVDGVKGTASEVELMMKRGGSELVELMVLHFQP